MCIFHKWEWNREIEVQETEYTRYDIIGNEIEPTITKDLYQEAYCKKCGKYKRQYIK